MARSPVLEEDQLSAVDDFGGCGTADPGGEELKLAIVQLDDLVTGERASAGLCLGVGSDHLPGFVPNEYVQVGDLAG
ncbi:hypothetical protein [Phytomonospora endophytica]|uniref:Uncharacterized protein n=1 Tax=Phytomonospora endophytica TaxID=714109 RepID=A0A841FL88_9ACTN|nr:hypothetical protein [Phytomonospora endophytica]MBB6036695.1 hypothetical protein [Phytomonospora endophytica]